MSNSKITMPVMPDDLERAIEGCNNGYLFVPTWSELQCARAHPDRFKVLPGTYPPEYVRIFTTHTYQRHFPQHIAQQKGKKCT